MRRPRRDPLKSAPAPGARRSSPHRRGALAEQVVADYLAAKGFHILGLNVRINRYEIDIVAQQRDVVAIVEVRTRGATSWQSALESIGPEKIRRLRTAGDLLWSNRFVNDPDVNRVRFDIATVTFEAGGETIVEYFEGAF